MLLGQDPLGDVTQDHQLAGGPGAPVGECLPPDVELVVPERQLAPLVRRAGGGRRVVGGLREQVVQSPPDELGPGSSQHPGAGGVHVHHPAEGVQHEHGVGHRVHDDATRERGQVEQPLPEDAPHEDPTGHDEQERSEVEAGERTHLEVVQRVGDPRQECRSHQRERHAPVGPREAHHGGHEDGGPHENQRVRVDEVHPEHPAGLHDRQFLPGRARRVEVDEVVGGGDRQQGQHDQRLGRQHGQHLPADQMPSSGVLQRERQPGRGQHADADVLHVAPEAPGGQVVRARGQLHGVEQPPPGGGGQQHRQAHAGGRPAPPGDVQRAPGQHQAGKSRETGKPRQHDPSPPRTADPHRLTSE